MMMRPRPRAKAATALFSNGLEGEGMHAPAAVPALLPAVAAAAAAVVVVFPR